MSTRDRVRWARSSCERADTEFKTRGAKIVDNRMILKGVAGTVYVLPAADGPASSSDVKAASRAEGIRGTFTADLRCATK